MDTSETAPSFAAPVAGGFVGAAPKLGAVVCGGEAGARGGGGGGGTRDGGGGGEGAAGARGGGGEGGVGEGVGALAIRVVCAAFATKPPKRVVDTDATPQLVAIGLRGGAPPHREAFGPVTGVGYLGAVACDAVCGVGEGVGALAIRDTGTTAIAFDLAGRLRGRLFCAYSLRRRWRSLRCAAVSFLRASFLRFRSFSLCASRFAGFCLCFIRYLPCRAVFARLCASSSASLCKSAALEDAVALEGALVALLEDGIVDQYAGFSTAEESEREERRGATATVGDNQA